MEHLSTERELICIGDIHGYYQALKGLKKKMNYNPQKQQLIYLGDYIDRGPDSYEVVEEVKHDVEHDEAIALLANHEEMAIIFLTATEPLNKVGFKQLWFHNGGEATWNSYQKHGVSLNVHLEFLKSLPLFYMNDEYLFVHAGINPQKRWEDQARDDLLWIREEFIFTPDLRKATDKMVVFGHTYAGYVNGGQPLIAIGHDRIAMDTGAARKARLSALNLTTQEITQVEIRDYY